MWDPYAEFKVAVLPNGLTVHVAEWSNRPWVRVGFVIHSGARHDLPGLEGTAHFVEHLVSRNATIPYREIEMFFDSTGGGVDLGATSYHATKYSFTSPVDPVHLARAFEIFGSMLLNARLENFIETQRQVILGEDQRMFPMPLKREMVGRTSRYLYGEDHFLGKPTTVLGDPGSIVCITQDDLQKFYDEHYAPANMSVVCVGGLDLDKVVSLLERSDFGRAKPGERKPLLLPLMDFRAPAETRYIFETSKHMKTEAPAQSIGLDSSAVVPIGVTKRPSLWMAREILNQILFDEVREARGWTYNIRAETRYHQELQVFSIQSEALVLESLDEVESVVDKCIQSIGHREDLFEEIRRNDLMSDAMLDLTANDLRNNSMADLINHQRIETLAEAVERVKALTMDDVREVLKWLRPERRFTVLRVP